MKTTWKNVKNNYLFSVIYPYNAVIGFRVKTRTPESQKLATAVIFSGPLDNYDCSEHLQRIEFVLQQVDS